MSGDARSACVLYSAERCAHCRQVKALLERHSVPFVTVDVPQMTRVSMEALRARVGGGLTVPQLFIGSELVGGLAAVEVRARGVAEGLRKAGSRHVAFSCAAQELLSSGTLDTRVAAVRDAGEWVRVRAPGGKGAVEVPCASAALPGLTAFVEDAAEESKEGDGGGEGSAVWGCAWRKRVQTEVARRLLGMMERVEEVFGDRIRCRQRYLGLLTCAPYSVTASELLSALVDVCVADARQARPRLVPFRRSAAPAAPSDRDVREAVEAAAPSWLAAMLRHGYVVPVSVEGGEDVVGWRASADRCVLPVVYDEAAEVEKGDGGVDGEGGASSGFCDGGSCAISRALEFIGLASSPRSSPTSADGAGGGGGGGVGVGGGRRSPSGSTSSTAPSTAPSAVPSVVSPVLSFRAHVGAGGCLLAGDWICLRRLRGKVDVHGPVRWAPGWELSDQEALDGGIFICEGPDGLSAPAPTPLPSSSSSSSSSASAPSTTTPPPSTTMPTSSAATAATPFRLASHLARLGEGFSAGERRAVLNAESLVVPGASAASSLASLAEALHGEALDLAERFVSADGRFVDYCAMRRAGVARRLSEVATRLRWMDLGGLEARARQCTLLNLYNVLTIHALAAWGPHKSAMERNSFYDRAAYRVGPWRLSLSVIEHGLLRGNARAPFALRPLLPPGDSRIPLAPAAAVDPRVHCALVCGARGCPAIRIFHPDRLDAMLDDATHAFLDANVRVQPRPDGHVDVALSQIFSWYRDDFGGSDAALLAWIVPRLPAPQQKAFADALGLSRDECSAVAATCAKDHDPSLLAPVLRTLGALLLRSAHDADQDDRDNGAGDRTPTGVDDRPSDTDDSDSDGAPSPLPPRAPSARFRRAQRKLRTMVHISYVAYDWTINGSE